MSAIPTFERADQPFDSSQGLARKEALERLAEQGPNEIEREKPTPRWILLAGHFNSPVIWLLLGACIISGLLGELADAIAIGTIVVINALVGFAQEYKAERSVLALRAMTAPRARVMRDGHPIMVPSAEVVVGDLLLLEPGDIVAADGQIVEAHVLTANEASLTGESAPVEKSTVPVASDAPLAERHNTVFMGTSIANGTGRAIVAATGMRTELGKVAHLLSTAEETETPLQQRLASVSRVLLYLCIGIVLIVAALGLLRGAGIFSVFLSAVSLAVAAVPEGLPAIVTIALAIGVQRMVSRHVLVRKLHAVETLGCASVICTDKTGTLTTGVMTVREMWGPDHNRLIDAAAACSDAELSADERSGIGDTTEVAILMAAAERGIRRDAIERSRARHAVNPFDSERKRMSIFRADGVLYVASQAQTTFTALDSATGATRWIYTGTSTFSDPAVWSGHVYTASLDGNLYVLDLDKGTEVKKFKLDSPVFGSPAVGGVQPLIPRVVAGNGVTAEDTQSPPLAFHAPPVVDELVPGDSDEPTSADLGDVAAPAGVHGREEHLGGQVLGDRPLPAPAQQVAVDLGQRLFVQVEQGEPRVRPHPGRLVHAYSSFRLGELRRKKPLFTGSDRSCTASAHPWSPLTR